jgi:hypothetical protein
LVKSYTVAVFYAFTLAGRSRFEMEWNILRIFVGNFLPVKYIMMTKEQHISYWTNSAEKDE